MKEALRGISLISGGASTCLKILREEKEGGILYGKTKTVAVIASSHKVSGLENVVKKAGFPREDTHVAYPGDGNLGERLLEIFGYYKPDFFHQLGWMPMTPEEVMEKYTGFNQHLGPGGRWMYGVRRVYAHMRFCQEVERIVPIPVFCQFVDPIYDAGLVVYVRYIDLDFKQTPEQNAEMLLPIEHKVQIEGRKKLFAGTAYTNAEIVPTIAENGEEEALLFTIRKKSRDKYPPEK